MLSLEYMRGKNWKFESIGFKVKPLPSRTWVDSITLDVLEMTRPPNGLHQHGPQVSTGNRPDQTIIALQRQLALARLRIPDSRLHSPMTLMRTELNRATRQPS